MIKASALLVALAIGLLVAGVVASSLLMVYVSIGVCALAALLLAAGVLAHWSEIFGRREARPVTPGAWSEPQVNVTAPVLASIQAVAAARASGRPGHEEAGVRPGGARPGGRTDGGRPAVAGRPSGPADGRRAPERPAEVDPSPAKIAGRDGEFPAPRPGDDLWERVEEELGSAAKRDTGALSWPATVFPPVSPGGPAPAESEAADSEARPPGEPRAGASAWLWDSGAGWPPPETADPAWPPPAAAFAVSPVAPGPAEPEPATSEPEPATAEPEPATPEPEPATPEPEPATPEPASSEPAEPEPGAPRSGGDVDAAGAPDPDEVAAEPAADAEVAHDVDVAEDAEVVLNDDGVLDDVVADGDVVPDDETVADHEAVPDTGDHQAADHEANEPAEPPGADAPAAGEPAANEPAVNEPVVAEPAAEEPAAKEPAAKQPGPGAPEPAAEEPSGDGAAAKPASGRVEVTVVPGVSRYHRRECILIRFLGAGDLEIMTKQEAVDAKFMACRACQPDQLED